MLWEKWIPEKYLVKSTVCGLEVLITDTGLKFYYTIIQNKNNKLNIIESGLAENIHSLPLVIRKNKIPLAISIVGKGLIFKKVTLPETDINYDDVLAQALPTIDVNDFLIQLYPQRDCDAYINIFRKEQIDTILKVISNEKYEIADVFLGYSFITDAVPITSLFDSIQTNSAIIQFSNNCIDDIKHETIEGNGNVTIEDLTLNKTNILGFASCFVYLLNSPRYYNFDGLKEFRTAHQQKNKLKVLSRAIIGLSFLLCLINFLCFTYYFEENKKLETELNLYEGKYEKINKLLSSYEKKRHLIEEAGILNDEDFTKSIDKIASTIPEEIILSNWVINPIVSKSEEDSLMKFSKGIISIKGNCDKSFIVNEWVNVLKAQNFVKNVNLEKFAYNNEGSQPNFELKIITE
ncbi:MAG TPA: hypothetical protein VN026_09860 [Bacteroidia bacterium]|nr:hypothetical protein [Bacteroidia bacterium]